MTLDEAVKRLQESPLSFEERTAKAYVRARGKCEYCDLDLVRDVTVYATAQIDHLLPYSKVERDIYEMEDNFVLSCPLCNHRKRNFLAINEGETAREMLIAHRAELVSRARKEVEERRSKLTKEWSVANSIFSGLSR